MQLTWHVLLLLTEDYKSLQFSYHIFITKSVFSIILKWNMLTRNKPTTPFKMFFESMCSTCILTKGSQNYQEFKLLVRYSWDYHSSRKYSSGELKAWVDLKTCILLQWIMQGLHLKSGLYYHLQVAVMVLSCAAKRQPLRAACGNHPSPGGQVQLKHRRYV